MLLIPGGTFLMGQEDGRDEERSVHRVTVAPFRLCRFQTTVAHWRRFSTAAGPDALPVTAVSWFDAVEHCRRLSAEFGRPFRLPTEAEWEFAARGGLGQALYPWGNEPVTSRPRYGERWKNGPEPVATSPPNRYGLYDMCENVHEWCSDWYDPGYYAVSPAQDPRGPAVGTRRASRGGAWRHH